MAKRKRAHRSAKAMADKGDAAKQSSLRRVPAKVWGAVGAIVVAGLAAVVVAIGTKWVDQLVPDPLPQDPKPGGGFTVAVKVIPKCGQDYALPDRVDPQSQAAELLAISPDDPKALPDYLQRHNGAPTDTITTKIVFTGTSAQPTRILEVAVARLQKAPNLSGTALRTRCEGDPPPRDVELDLDKPPRQLTAGGKPYFDQHELDVKVEERETLHVIASAMTNSYRWVYAVSYVDSAGKNTTGYFGIDGQVKASADQVPPAAEFSLTGAATTYGAAYEESSGRFYEDGN